MIHITTTLKEMITSNGRISSKLYDKVITPYIDKIEKENKKLRECLEFYAYPNHEDGDRAYLFGHEARECLKSLNE